MYRKKTHDLNIYEGCKGWVQTVEDSRGCGAGCVFDDLFTIFGFNHLTYPTTRTTNTSNTPSTIGTMILAEAVPLASLFAVFTEAHDDVIRKYLHPTVISAGVW